MLKPTELYYKIENLGAHIRDLKVAKKDTTKEFATLLILKYQYKKESGQDWKPLKCVP